MTEITIAGELVSQNCQFDKTALIIKRTLNWEECQILVNCLHGMHTAIAWYAGDLMNYTYSLFGENFAQLFKDWDPQTLSNWKWVAKSIPASRRRETVKWSIHAQVAKLPSDQQEKWLQATEENKWSVRQLKEAMTPKVIASSSIEETSPTTEFCNQGSEDENGFEVIICPFCGESWRK